MAKKQYVSPEIDLTEGSAPKGGNYGLPFGLCKKYGIAVGEGWTPRDAWNALKGIGITPENAYKDLKKEENKKKTDIGNKFGADDGEEHGELRKKRTKEEINNWAKKNNISIQDKVFSKIPENIAIEQVSTFIDLYEKFPTKRNGAMYFDTDKLSDREVARAEYSASVDTIGIKLDTNSFNSDYEKQVEDNVKAGWWGDIPKKNYKYYSVAHEYGHLIEYSIISKKDFNQKLRDKLPQMIARYGFSKSALKKAAQKEGVALRKELFYDQIFPEIFAKAKEYDPSITIPKTITSIGYKTAPKVSGYSTKDWAEYFAESFAIGILGGNNPIGKATVDIVKKYFGDKT